MSKPKKDLVFLSYAHDDLEKVKKVYQGLLKRGLDVWFDKENLGPGRWAKRVRKAIAQSRYFVICISEAALRKMGDERPGFQDEELDIAYRIAMDQGDAEFTIVPVRIEDCDRGDQRLATFNQYDLFPDFDQGLDRLAIDLGGHSLSDAEAIDERVEDQKTVDRLLGKAEAAYYAAEYNKGIALLDSALAINPDVAFIWWAKGFGLGELDRYEEALKAYEKAVELKPDDDRTWFNRACMFSLMGRKDEAIADLKKAIEIDPVRKEKVKTDKDFKSLWDDEDFKKLTE